MQYHVSLITPSPPNFSLSLGQNEGWGGLSDCHACISFLCSPRVSDIKGQYVSDKDLTLTPPTICA
jgi:hypothetical protein